MKYTYVANYDNSKNLINIHGLESPQIIYIYIYIYIYRERERERESSSVKYDGLTFFYDLQVKTFKFLLFFEFPGRNGEEKPLVSPIAFDHFTGHLRRLS